MVAANVNAGSVIPNSDTETASTLRSFAIGERFAVTISPAAPTMTNMKYIRMNTGLATHDDDAASNAPIQRFWLPMISGRIVPPP
jgi:hypothetical protein